MFLHQTTPHPFFPVIVQGGLPIMVVYCPYTYFITREPTTIEVALTNFPYFTLF